MSAPPTDWTNPVWWTARVRLLARPTVRRHRAAILATVGWIILYPLLIVEALLYPSEIILVIVVTILTSEGFASTSILLWRWAGSLGTAYFEAAKDVIRTEVEGNGRAILASELGSVVDGFEPCLDKTYAGIFGRVDAKSACSVEAMCIAIALACRPPGPAPQA